MPWPYSSIIPAPYSSHCERPGTAAGDDGDRGQPGQDPTALMDGRVLSASDLHSEGGSGPPRLLTSNKGASPLGINERYPDVRA